MESFITSNLYRFHKSLLNFERNSFVSKFFQGASADWWNHMHFQHHSKPNIIDKDPDTRIEPVFVLGETIPKRVRRIFKKFEEMNWVFCQAAHTNAKYGKGLPYDLQYLYFFIGKKQILLEFLYFF